MPVGYKVLTPVSAEPITLSDAKKWLRVDFDDDDETIAELIIDARRYAENILQRSLATQTIQAVIGSDPVPTGLLSGPVAGPIDAGIINAPLFGDAVVSIDIPMGPLQSFTLLEYQSTRRETPEWTTIDPLDDAGNANYRIDMVNDPNKLYLFSSLAAARYRLKYVAGYTSIPPDIRRNILSLIGFWYLNREGQNVPTEIDMKFARKRVFSL